MLIDTWIVGLACILCSLHVPGNVEYVRINAMKSHNVISFLCIVGYDLQLWFYLEYLHVCSWWVLVCGFLFFSVWFWYAGLIEWIGTYSICFNLPEEFVHNWYYFSLKYLEELGKATGSGVFFGGGRLTTNSISLLDIKLFKLSISSWVSFHNL